MALSHGKVTYFSLDDLSGAPQNISAFFRSASGLLGSVERPPITGFGDSAVRKGMSGLKDGGPISLGAPLRFASGNPVHGKSVRGFLGQYALCSKLRSMTVRRAVDLPNTDQYCDTWRQRDVVGHLSGGLSFSGLYNGTTGEIGPIFQSMFESETPTPVSIAYAGAAIGSYVDLLKVVLTTYNINSPHDGLTEVTAESDADGQVDMGVSLHDNSTETGAAPIGYTSVNESAASTAGAVAHLHITAFTGTDITVKIQHSTNDSTWADLMTFTTATGAGSERAEVASGVPINQYVRAQVSAGTFASATFTVAFARRGYTNAVAGSYRHLAGLYGKADSSTYSYGPQGNTTGLPNYTGECRLSSLEATLNHDALLEYTAELVCAGAVTVAVF